MGFCLRKVYSRFVDYAYSSASLILAENLLNVIASGLELCCEAVFVRSEPGFSHYSYVSVVILQMWYEDV